MNAEVLSQSICVPSLVLIARVVFLLESGHTRALTKSQMPLTTLPEHQLPPASVINMGFHTWMTNLYETSYEK